MISLKAVPRHILNLFTQPYYIHYLHWRLHKGDETKRDETKRDDYALDANALIFDGGGYRGNWTAHMNEKFDCKVHVFEPVPKYFNMIRERFENNGKITTHCFGLAGRDDKINITLDEDASSAFGDGQNKVEIVLRDISSFIKENGIEYIDLLKLNVEGAEYDILDRLIETGDIRKVGYIQIQFHHFVPNSVQRRHTITEGLKKTHNCDWSYPFIWESWSPKSSKTERS